MTKDPFAGGNPLPKKAEKEVQNGRLGLWMPMDKTRLVGYQQEEKSCMRLAKKTTLLWIANVRNLGLTGVN